MRSGLEVLGVSRRAVPEGFEEFYDQAYGRLVGLARVLTGDHQVAEDLVQDVCAAALGRWDSIDQSRGVDPCCGHQPLGFDVATPVLRAASVQALAASTPRSYLLPEPTEEFWAEVRALPRRQAQVLVLHYLEDLSTHQIASILECAESTVRVHLTRGRRALAGRRELTHD